MKHLLTILYFCCLFLCNAQNWTSLNDFPGTERDDGVGFVIGDSAYFGTGLTPWWSAKSDFYGLNLTNDSWFNIAPLPSGEERQYACAFTSSSNFGFVFGGQNGSQFMNDLWRYNPQTNSWQELTSLPDSGRSGSACFVINDTAYIVGGITSSNQIINELWAYSIQDDVWLQKSNFPFGNRWRSSASSYNNLGYLIFGKDENATYSNALYKYDPALDNWQQVSVFPGIGRTHAALTSHSNGLYLMCGIDSTDNSNNDLWTYSPTQDLWQSLQSMPALGRRGGIALTSGNTLYYSTGIDAFDQRLKSTLKYSPVLSINEAGMSSNKTLVKIVDLLGRETLNKPNKLLIYIYSDGTAEKVYRIE